MGRGAGASGLSAGGVDHQRPRQRPRRPTGGAVRTSTQTARGSPGPRRASRRRPAAARPFRGRVGTLAPKGGWGTGRGAALTTPEPPGSKAPRIPASQISDLQDPQARRGPAEARAGAAGAGRARRACPEPKRQKSQRKKSVNFLFRAKTRATLGAEEIPTVPSRTTQYCQKSPTASVGPQPTTSSGTARSRATTGRCTGRTGREVQALFDVGSGRRTAGGTPPSPTHQVRRR